ncbi:hypothetical protein MMC25_002995 [Agyrium rufum]|nr:hypothetical protein [Agyrium rufum]
MSLKRAPERSDMDLVSDVLEGFEALLDHAQIQQRKIEKLIQEIQSPASHNHTEVDRGTRITPSTDVTDPNFKSDLTLRRPKHLNLDTSNKRGFADPILESSYEVKPRFQAGYRAWKVLVERRNTGKSLIGSKHANHPRSQSQASFQSSRSGKDSFVVWQNGKIAGTASSLPDPASQQNAKAPSSIPTPPAFEPGPVTAPDLHRTTFEKPASPPASANAATSKCPIRFLNQQPPEEIARYFEEHKHEIPRSHEICVKRYQTNSESIRRLDEKYGSLVSMIKGLGMKHQPMLHMRDDDDVAAERASVPATAPSNEKISKWANDVVDEDGEVEGDDGNDPREPERGRAAHSPLDEENFGETLREIRVGESPSRPWGISVPVNAGLALSDSGSDRSYHEGAVPDMSVRKGRKARKTQDSEFAQPHKAVEVDPVKQSRCPFASMGLPNPHTNTKETSHGFQRSTPQVPPTKEASGGNEEGIAQKRSATPRMLFTGPVFIGYGPEQISAFMKDYNGAMK